MLLNFFLTLRRYRVPISIRELLDLLLAMKYRLVWFSQDEFYALARLCLVKDEKYFDRFDRAFAAFFDGVDTEQGLIINDVTLQQLREMLKQVLPAVEPRLIESTLDDYALQLSEARAEVEREANPQDYDVRKKQGTSDTGSESQEPDSVSESDDARESGDNGNSDADEGDGADGQEGEKGDNGQGEEGEAGEEGEEGEEGEGNEGDEGSEGEGRGEDGEQGEGISDEGKEGERTELEEPGNLVARKLWQLREYQDLDPDVELGTRNIKMALRRLRRFTRSAADLELDLRDTIDSTARNAGLLDIKMVPERHNAVKVLLLLDVGGSMDEHIELCAQLFSAAESEFKHLSFYYYHNFIYETLWLENSRRGEDRFRILDLFRTYGPDYKVILVGDALMGLQEITQVGGSVEHYNAQSGEAWLTAVRDHFRRVVWLNPLPVYEWQQQPSIRHTRQLMEDQMYHLSPEGIEQAMKVLVR